MRAIWQLWLQTWRQAVIPTALGQVLWFCAILLMLLNRGDRGGLIGSLGFLSMGTFLAHIGVGQTLRNLCRPESFLLPRFRLHLLGAALLDLGQWVLLPGLLAHWLELPYAGLIATCLFGVASLGLSIGCGRRVGLFVWVIAIGAGWKPQLATELAHAALDSSFTTPMLLLLIGALLAVTLMPLLSISDPDTEDSPLESMGLGRMNNSPGGVARPRSALAKRVASWFDLASQHALDVALSRYRRRPGARQRLALVRSLLLPHDNPIAIALRLVLVALVVTAYFFAIQHRQQFDAAVVGAYAILLAMSRFPQFGRGMLRMQPNLADLYLTLAPTTRAAYQKTIADALLLLVPVSVLTALTYTLLGIVLVHAEEPGRMLLTALIIAAAASLTALGVHLIGPTSTFGRGIANFVLILGAMGSYWCGYWLIGSFGYVFGGGLVAAVALSFGITVWLGAQREYLRRAPCFDALPGSPTL